MDKTKHDKPSWPIEKCPICGIHALYDIGSGVRDYCAICQKHTKW